MDFLNHATCGIFFYMISMDDFGAQMVKSTMHFRYATS